MGLAIGIWIACAAATAYIAANKGRDPATWAAIGAIGGIFALIAIAAVPEKAK